MKNLLRKFPDRIERFIGAVGAGLCATRPVQPSLSRGRDGA